MDPITWAVDAKHFDAIRTMSEGTFDIDHLECNEIVPTEEAMEAVANDVIQMTATFAAQRAGKNPAFEFLGSWPCGPNQWQWQVWYAAGDGMKYLDQVYGEFGIKAFPAPKGMGEALAFSKTKISSLAEMKGLSYRLGPGAGQEIAKRLGMNPTWCPGEEVYTTLERGVVDIAKWGGPADTWGMKLHEIAPYILWPGYPMPGEVFMYEISLDNWNNKMSAAHKEMLYQAVYNGWGNDLWQFGRDNADGWQRYIDYGVTMTRLSDADIDLMRTVSFEVVGEYEDQNPLIKEIVENQKAFLGAFGEWQAYNDLPFKPPA